MVSIQVQLTQHLHKLNRWWDDQLLADSETVGDVQDRARCDGSANARQAEPVLGVLCRAARDGDQLAVHVIIAATTATRQRAARDAPIDPCKLLGDVVEIMFTANAAVDNTTRSDKVCSSLLAKRAPVPSSTSKTTATHRWQRRQIGAVSKKPLLPEPKLEQR